MKKSFLITIALFLVAIGAYCVSGIYARYTEEVEKSGDVTVAKWTFKEDNDGVAQPFTINLADTYDTNKLVEGKIAPGTSGSFDIVLKNTNTETAVDVSIVINKENVPTNLKFYSDEQYTNEVDPTQLNAILKAKDGEGLTKTIYWKWAYNETPDTTIDGADTTDGKNATGDNGMKVTLTITGTQVAPEVNTTKVESSAWK